jgi:hypothetical protein
MTRQNGIFEFKKEIIILKIQIPKEIQCIYYLTTLVALSFSKKELAGKGWI